jgi:hypothetical protein
MRLRRSLLIVAPLLPLVATAHAADDEPLSLAAGDSVLIERRRDALRRELLDARGRRDTHDLALDDDVVEAPLAGPSEPGSAPLLAIDADAETAWRGAQGAGPWVWTLPFRRVVHLGLVRMHLGDAADRGVPAAFRVEVQPPVGGRCEPDSPWQQLPGGGRDDRDGNTFVHGPQEIHAQRQALFADDDACGLRLYVPEGAGAPVVRSLHVLESAPSATRSAGVSIVVSPSGGTPALAASRPEGVVDGTYAGLWAGEIGAGRWSVTVRLPEAVTVDRLRLVLGQDAVTTPRAGRPGRDFSGGYLPTSYRVSTSHDDDPSHLIPLQEASPVDDAGRALPVRRRLVKLGAPRPIKLLRLDIDEATGPWGERDRRVAAPVVREIGLYRADDPRPVVSEPVFLSVDANPAGLIASRAGGAANADGVFARDAFHRLRRVVLGFDADTRWPADASRKRDDGTGRFLEVIEGDDPLLAAPLLRVTAPPPVVVLSGSFDWEFDRTTGPSDERRGHWSWNVAEPAGEGGGGMGQLRAAVQARSAPFIGFCGGAQILALLEAMPAGAADDAQQLALVDQVLLRNGNRPVRGLVTRKLPYERTWWSDGPELDATRPSISFDRGDPLFDAAAGSQRDSSREIPTSHGDMLRLSAFSGPLARLRVAAHSDFCRSWVVEGPEETALDPADPSRRCVRMPQAFRSRDPFAYPVIGFQFHPEQRDLTRLAPGSPAEARGDALNAVANAIELALLGYLRVYWPDA